MTFSEPASSKSSVSRAVAGEISAEFKATDPGGFYTTGRKQKKREGRFKKLNRADFYSGNILGQYSPLESKEDSITNVKPSALLPSITTAAVKDSAVKDTSIKKQTIGQTLTKLNYSSSSSSADNVFEKDKIASLNNHYIFEAIPALESVEGKTDIKEDKVDEVLKAKEDCNSKSVSNDVVTKDNEISDKLNRLESLILILLKERTRVPPISAPNCIGALCSDPSIRYFFFRFSFSGNKLNCCGS